MDYQKRLEAVLLAPTVQPDHKAWHKAFGNDCRVPNCPLKREKEKTQ